MDKMMRRKPKPPAIETDVDRRSTDTSASSVSIVHQSDGYLPSPETTSRPTTATGTTPEPATKEEHQKKSKFNLRPLGLRSSSKRARDSASPLGIRKADDKKQATRRTPEADSNDAPADKGPVMPKCLSQSRQQIDAKFTDLGWDERLRLAAGASKENPQWRWGLYQQPPAHAKPIMDRYMNIKPFNHNRVKLKVPAGELDYVNASDIILTSPSDAGRQPLRYIAMQGPTQPSFEYVWRMIAEHVENPAVIVQLTQNFEHGQRKCDQYFPALEEPEWSLGDQDEWNDGWRAKLVCRSHVSFEDGAIQRSELDFTVGVEKEPRKVWHFEFTRWPDFGVPESKDISSFFELMRLSREHSSPNGPRVIHCSAGIGRTGSFIALEHLIRELEVGALCEPSSEEGRGASSPRPDVICAVVSDLRTQRRGMVQSEVQYRFIHQVMRDLWTKQYGPPSAKEHEDRPPAAKRRESDDPFTSEESSGGVPLDGHDSNSGPSSDR